MNGRKGVFRPRPPCSPGVYDRDRGVRLARLRSHASSRNASAPLSYSWACWLSSPRDCSGAAVKGTGHAVVRALRRRRARNAGLRWTNPFYSRRGISLRVRNSIGQSRSTTTTATRSRSRRSSLWRNRRHPRRCSRSTTTTRTSMRISRVRPAPDGARLPYDAHDSGRPSPRSHGDDVQQRPPARRDQTPQQNRRRGDRAHQCISLCPGNRPGDAAAPANRRDRRHLRASSRSAVSMRSRWRCRNSKQAWRRRPRQRARRWSATRGPLRRPATQPVVYRHTVLTRREPPCTTDPNGPPVAALFVASVATIIHSRLRIERLEFMDHGAWRIAPNSRFSGDIVYLTAVIAASVPATSA